MPKKIHFAAGVLATLTIASFFLSTVIVETLGGHDAVAAVKALIVMPMLTETNSVSVAVAVEESSTVRTAV